MLTLVEDLRALSKRDLRLPSEPKSLSTSSLKGIIQRTLDQYPFLLVLDHLSAPSRVVTGMVKEMNYYGRTPVFFAAGYVPHGRHRDATADVRGSLGAGGNKESDPLNCSGICSKRV